MASARLLKPFAACSKMDCVPDGEVRVIWLHGSKGVVATFTVATANSTVWNGSFTATLIDVPVVEAAGTRPGGTATTA